MAANEDFQIRETGLQKILSTLPPAIAVDDTTGMVFRVARYLEERVRGGRGNVLADPHPSGTLAN